MPTFSEVYPTLPIEALVKQSLDTGESAVRSILERGQARSVSEFAALISPEAGKLLEPLARQSRQLTQKHFGKTIRMFAPLYPSNECINICDYCSFSRNNPIPRITLPVSQVVEEAGMLARRGFRTLLLVAGEHPKYVSGGYIEECIRDCLPLMPSIWLELGPLETEAYIPMVRAGSESLIAYQETYHKPTYKDVHPAGPKKRYAWRMDTPERAYAAGFRRLGIGALYGLYDWQYEAISVAAHAQHLLQQCWKAQVSISMPRLRPAYGGYHPDPSFKMSDRQFTQLLCAFRLFLPHAGIALSTREAPALRDGLVQLGVTTMSAGSSTEPGGYSRFDETTWTQKNEQPGEQFHIADERSPQAVADMIRRQGYEPVWKDFDQSLATPEYANT